MEKTIRHELFKRSYRWSFCDKYQDLKGNIIHEEIIKNCFECNQNIKAKYLIYKHRTLAYLCSDTCKENLLNKPYQGILTWCFYGDCDNKFFTKNKKRNHCSDECTLKDGYRPKYWNKTQGQLELLNFLEDITELEKTCPNLKNGFIVGSYSKKINKEIQDITKNSKICSLKAY